MVLLFIPLNRRRPASAVRGNSLIEYAIPLAMIMVSAGVLLTLSDATSLLGEYFMSASGHSMANLSGTTFKTKGLAAEAFGNPGNGIGGFTNFGSLANGNGNWVPSSGGGRFYTGDYSRTGARPSPPSPEVLYP